MSYREKRNIVSIATNIIILAIYGYAAFQRYQSGVLAVDNLQAWARLILTFIGITIVATILIQIVFHILLSVSIAVNNKIQNEQVLESEIERNVKAEFVEDEMNKQIELRASRVVYIFSGVGFFAGLIAIAIGQPVVIMLNIIFAMFFLGGILEGAMQLYFYRKGIQHA